MSYTQIGVAIFIVVMLLAGRLHLLKLNRQKRKPASAVEPTPDELCLGNVRPIPPKSRGLSEDERASERARFAYEARLRSISSFDLTKRRAEYVGSKGYRWRTAGDTDVCPTCAEHNGKFFKWTAPPPCGPPGTHSLCPQGYCRCYAEAQIP